MKTKIFAFFILIVLIPTAFAAEIHDAARAGDLVKVKALLEKDPGLIRAVDSEGKTPLHGAAEIGQKEVAAYLIEKGAVIDQRDAMNRTPLWWCAARSRSVEIARLLLDKGADINATDGGWGPPLMMAAVGGFAPMVDLFLERGVAIPGPSDPTMSGLVTYSVRNGLVKLVNRLVSTGLNVLAKDDAGDSLMHKAAAGGSPEIIDLFVKAGLSVSEADAIGWTPLHFAAESGRLRAVEILLAKGAPLDARTTEGKTALNLALEWKKKDVADFLAAKGADRSEPKFPVLTGPYLGQKLPGKTPELFARGIVAAKYAFHSGVSFSPDGQSAYWSVQEYGGQMASLESTVVNGRWTMPKPMSFVVLGQTDDVPFPSPDGRKLFFVSGRPMEKGGRGGKENIWVMDRTTSGWSEPRPLPVVINAMNMHWQVSVDLRGNLYFGAREEGGQGFGQQDIYCSKFENGTYAKPENLGAVINGPGFEHSPFIAPDGSYLIFSKSNPQARVDSLFISFRKPDGTWSRSRELNSVMGYRNRSMCPWVTPDGKYLFFAGIVAGENMPYWVEAGFIEDLRKAALLPSASEIVGATIEKEGPAAAEAKFKELRARPDKYSFVERDFNLLGYRFLQSGALPEAIAVFRMNVELFPESANNYDSLGEAYMTAGDKAASKANYQRAVEKDSNSANAKAVLASFDSNFERTQSEWNNPLAAVRSGNLARVKSLFAKTPGFLSARDGEGQTPLHLAAMAGRMDLVAFLLEKGAAVDEKNTVGRTPLWLAAWQSGDPNLIKFLVEKGADVRAQDVMGLSVLGISAIMGRRESIDYLFDRGATLPPPGSESAKTLLSSAVTSRLSTLLDRLISAGADLKARDAAGISLLHKAAMSSSADIIAKLLKAGLLVSEADLFGWTPLNYAAEAGNREAADALLAAGASIDVRTRDGRTPFDLARDWGRSEISVLLAAKGADQSGPKFPVLAGNYFGQKSPGRTPEPFALGIVASRNSFHGNIVFSPDGTEAYWSVMDWGGDWAILESKIEEGRWSKPRRSPFSLPGQGDDSPFVSPDGKNLYFVSGRPLQRGGRPGKENIWVMERVETGWSEPRPLPQTVNALQGIHWSVSVDRQGYLYLGSTAPGGAGLSDIYCAKFTNGQFGRPENLGPMINGPASDFSPFISPDGNTLMFSGNADQKRRLFISFRKPDGTWTKAKDLSGVVPYKNGGHCPQLTPDGKYLFYLDEIGGYSPFWVEAGFIEELRKAELSSAAAVADDFKRVEKRKGD